MTNCNAEKSSGSVHSNYWENCPGNIRYEDFYRFNQDQFYEGEFFRDSIHGQGTYTWKNVAVYEGGFYSNSKDGYASLSFADNSYFEGLFVKNRPFGPGILTYANGRQDAGFWMGRKLIRLSRAVDYIIPRLAPTSAAKIKLLQFKRLLPLNEEFYDSTTDLVENLDYHTLHFPTPYSNVIYDPRSTFFDKQMFDKTYFINAQELSNEFIKDPKDLENVIRQSIELKGEEEESTSLKAIRTPSHCLCQQDVLVVNYESLGETDVCERESNKGELEMGILAYFTKFGTIERLERNEGEDEGDVKEGETSQEKAEMAKDGKSKCPKILLWNRSELCKEILKQMFRYREFEEKLNFNLAKLMLGARTAFRRTGEKEKQCLQLLKMCALGPPHAVKDLLCSYEISQDLMDGRGNNSLMFAAAADQHDVIDILLDYGVDVNNFNDEGLTPLNLCLLRKLALTNGISSWETAFLPQEIDKSLFPDDIQDDEFKTFQSISSLDRIFGDGMSVYNSKSLIHENRFLALLPTPSSLLKESYQSMSIKTQDFFDSLDTFNLSQITILDLLRSPKNYSLIALNADGETLQNLNSFCSLRTIDPTRGLKSDEPTPRVNAKIIPKTNKKDEFEKSLLKASTDRYLFEFSFKTKPNAGGIKKEKGGAVKSSKGKTSKMLEKEKTVEEEQQETEKLIDLELNRRARAIDKTIEKLLKRGADPNISEVPKPSIHLGVHTKDLDTIYTLLLYGASPDSQLYPNEGLLTPLHVIVLQEADQKNVQICEMLLQFGANPELETAPEFVISEEEKNFLDSECGRTPLQLLCMRPDLEYADPENFQNLIKVGFLLAYVSDKRHFYNGHSCLTLAMLCGNLKLLKSLLESKCFDPNDILDKERGTALHVLVSTELQRITSYDTSIKMCDLLVAEGANPLKKFKHPQKLLGTCVDYGYREIEAEKEARKANVSGKKDATKSARSGKEKTPVRDYLKDHERVVEYLSKIATTMSQNKETDSVKKNRRVQNLSSEGGSERGGKDGGGKDKNKGKQMTQTESREKKEIPAADESGRANDYSEVEKDKKNFPRNVESAEKKETERKAKNDRASWEGKADLKYDKKRKKGTEGESKKPKWAEKKEGEKTKEKEKRKTETRNSDKANLKKDLTRGNHKPVCSKSQGTRSETKFPEKLRQALLQLYGSRIDIDINELLVPYVVLRNGELYYRFQKKPSSQKEQYSLI